MTLRWFYIYSIQQNQVKICCGIPDLVVHLRHIGFVARWLPIALPCKKLYTRSSVQNATWDRNKRSQNNADTMHKPSDRKAVRAR